MSDVSPGVADSVPQDAALADVFPIAVRAVKTGDVETLTRLLHEHPTLANARALRGRTLLLHLCDWPGHCPRERPRERRDSSAVGGFLRRCRPGRAPHRRGHAGGWTG